MENNWLEKLKIGDKVVVSSDFGGDRIQRVERTTKTQIVLKGSSSKYRKNSGFLITGDVYNTTYLKEATEDAVDLIKQKLVKNSLLSSINKIIWRDLETNTLQQVLDLVERSKK